MKKALIALFFILSFSACVHAQNGPTPPSVKLSWTQSTSSGLTANCVYRGSASGTYSLPALFCSTAPITTYTDTTVIRGTTYHYAVTAQASSIEGGYSNDVTAAIQLAPIPPVVNQTPTQTELKAPTENIDAHAHVVIPQKNAVMNLTAEVRY